MELNEPSAKYLVQGGLQQTEIGPIPLDWQVEPLAKVAEIRSGIAKNVNSVLQDAIEVPYLRVANVQDGYLDLQAGTNISMNVGGTNNYLRVNTVGTVSNKNGIGARVEITSASGTQIRDVKSGDGFKYMSSLMTHFGLGNDKHG